MDQLVGFRPTYVIDGRFFVVVVLAPTLVKWARLLPDLCRDDHVVGSDRWHLLSVREFDFTGAGDQSLGHGEVVLWLWDRRFKLWLRAVGIALLGSAGWIGDRSLTCLSHWVGSGLLGLVGTNAPAVTTVLSGA